MFTPDPFVNPGLRSLHTAASSSAKYLTWPVILQKREDMNPKLRT
ncbi:hypothetical protein FOQG_04678 [Fusarium oxysporum f. sp. raphani 54005]|uniref:Uncharacterized protein n=2 Tax=Fusarium oxysporum TaxID=5507 RepID=X0DJZ9_FUSOX|nr:hypothetical protein FOQG_04678 [Fusarium oxysporum f. sp. raphani 54005]EXL85841.1 hypothetical protein FOPG_02593 [Fusarium oxysporum f. sp. conglutinans race 2 54008]